MGECAIPTSAGRRPGPAIHPGGFTVVELLVVIGVVVLLVGLLLPALRSIKSSGQQTVELSAAKHLMSAYINYAAAHNDFVLPGFADWVPYRDAHPASRQLLAYDKAGKEIAGGLLDIARQRYVWRLAPYMSYNLRGLYTNENQELLETLEQDDYAQYLYKASLAPALGLNTEWIGGDSSAYGFEQPTSAAYSVLDYDHFYIKSMGQTRVPDKLMVFASARGRDHFTGSVVVEGWYKIRSPYFSALEPYRWSVNFNANEDPINYGFISPRYGGSAVIGFIDGHTGMLTKDQLKDMRHWANWATHEDWRLPVNLP